MSRLFDWLIVFVPHNLWIWVTCISPTTVSVVINSFYSRRYCCVLGSLTFNFTVETSGATFYDLHIFDDCAKSWLTLRFLLILQTLQKLIVFYKTHINTLIMSRVLLCYL